ncbi:Uncharacterized protein Adt_02022 [Abeliophyllum distichum]|uniref:Uncharacterized protein n=1 Tax=Abeliophyllum distichum TaxID=126358 RepID=A0ABD1VUH6_9LAMI
MSGRTRGRPRIEQSDAHPLENTWGRAATVAVRHRRTDHDLAKSDVNHDGNVEKNGRSASCFRGTAGSRGSPGSGCPTCSGDPSGRLRSFHQRLCKRMTRRLQAVTQYQLIGRVF